MEVFAKNYFEGLKNSIDAIIVTSKSLEEFSLSQGIEQVCRKIIERTDAGKKLIFIGNGASAAISSHMATDFWKNGKMRAVAFNDSSLLTCIGNDYGFPHLFEKPVEMFADDGDILVAISSSGQSENILNAVAVAVKQDCSIVTFSGFKETNPLRLSGDINFYVPVIGYGPVEILHQAIIHCVLDSILECKNG